MAVGQEHKLSLTCWNKSGMQGQSPQTPNGKSLKTVALPGVPFMGRFAPSRHSLSCFESLGSAPPVPSNVYRGFRSVASFGIPVRPCGSLMFASGAQFHTHSWEPDAHLRSKLGIKVSFYFRSSAFPISVDVFFLCLFFRNWELKFWTI